MNYFTADLHLLSEHVIRDCRRPFKDAQDFYEWTIDVINKTCKTKDTLWVIGDMIDYSFEDSRFRNKENWKEAIHWVEYIKPSINLIMREDW